VIRASAPGKLVLLGEYAVLHGHPAVVTAVDRRAVVDLGPVDDDHWMVSAPGFHDDETGFSFAEDGGFRWCGPGADAAARLGLIERVIGSLATKGLIAADGMSPASLALDTRAFFRSTPSGPAKLGLGSSAALTVALTAALRQRQGSDPLDLGGLLDLHRSLQGGRGSGIDLAASLHGGVVEYRLTGAELAPSARALALPVGLQLVFVWTGRSASTSVFLERLEERLDDDDGTVGSVIDDLGRLSASGIDCLRNGDLAGFLGEVGAFGRSMERLGKAAGMPVLSDEHRLLRGLAEDCGVAYKPSGAGGGDVGIGFADDPERLGAFMRRFVDAGFPALDLECEPTGLRAHRPGGEAPW
jgi:phosphomevalonate kinase